MREDATLAGAGGTGFPALAATVFCILAVVVLAYGTTRWLAKRPFLGGMSRSMRVLERLIIDRAHSILIIRADGRRLMIGVAPSGITLLRELPERPEDEDAPAAESPPGALGKGEQKPPWIRWAEGIGGRAAGRTARQEKPVFRIPDPPREDSIDQLSERIRRRSHHFDATRKDDDRS